MTSSAGMKQIFRVGDEVFAKVDGFEPFPAIVQSVRLTGNECSVFYYVRFPGTTEIVPLTGEKLEPLEGNKHKFKKKYDDKELRKGSKLRVDAILGAEDEIPEVLMNFVSVDSDFEEVSEEVVTSLGLCSIQLTPSMIQKLDDYRTPINGEAPDALIEDEFVDVEEVNESSNFLDRNPNPIFSCTVCHKHFRTRKALSTHKQRSVLCRKLNSRETVRSEQTQYNKKKSSDSSFSESTKLWASRSVSRYYPCKLCFRKFRSLGEAQLHMSSHKSHPKRDTPKIQFKSQPQVSEDSESGVTDDSRYHHNNSERFRRAELAAKFTELASVVVVDHGASKIKILEVAKLTIRDLEQEFKHQDQELVDLQARNRRLLDKFEQLKVK